VTPYLTNKGFIQIVDDGEGDPHPIIPGPFATFDDAYAAIEASGYPLCEDKPGFRCIIKADAVCEYITEQVAEEYARRAVDDDGYEARIPEWIASEAGDFVEGYMFDCAAEGASMRGLREMRADIRAAQERVL
jgi:hypothetical protein